MMELITTVGYGDYTPTTDAGRIMVALHILFAGIIISGIITELVSWLVEQHAEQSSSSVASFFDDGDPTTTTWLEILQPILVSLFFFALAIAVWVVFFVNFCDFMHMDIDLKSDGMHVCEDRQVIEATYMAIVTMTTVGFGDVTPRTSIGELFASLWCFVGIGFYLRLVGVITETFLKAKETFKMDEFSAEDITMADESGEGKVDLFEFTKFVLSRFKLVESKVFQEIEGNFKALDQDGSGYLDAADVAGLCHGSSNRRQSRTSTHSYS